MKLTRDGFYLLSNQNVLEIKFVRRRIADGRPLTRRMLCTNSKSLLLSELGREVLHYRIPHGRLPYDPNAKNLCITWDIFMQNFRAVNMDQCELISKIDQNKFWEYFTQNLYSMTTEQKQSFMDI